MKHQYFGDVSDYKKYGILRALTTNPKIKLLVCWMLTPSDKRTDGNNNSYLKSPDKWRHHEPDIFDFLYESVVANKIKDLSLVEKNDIIPRAVYFNEVLLDNLADRQTYFENLQKFAKNHNLIFFDPDNGIATPSVTKGKKGSSKYIFWDEIEKFWSGGHSLLIYQHFPRVERLKYIHNIYEQINNRFKVHKVYAFKTTHMVYFLLIQEKHKDLFTGIEKRINEKWNGVVKVIMLR